MIYKDKTIPTPSRKPILTILAVMLVFFSWGSFFAYYISPQYAVIFQWLGLLMPALILLNLLLLFVGLFQSRLLAIVAAFGLLGCIHYVPKIVQLTNISSDTPADLRLATFNVRQFRMEYNLPSAELIAEWLDEHQIDAICLQEVPKNYSASALKSAFPDMPHQLLTSDEEGQLQLAILSKYPILHAETISFKERSNCALIADLLVQGQPLRILNYHLQTTNWNQVQMGSNLLFTGRFEENCPIKILSKNFRHRADQALQLSKTASASTYPTILCGDMNDSPVSYVYRTMLGNMKDAFCEVGQGYSYTYRCFLKLFRIDFVFFTQEKLQALRYHTPHLSYSDHLPVIVDFKFKEKDS